MSKLNWQGTNQRAKRSLSTKDEAEFRERDAASRWLGRMACKHCGSVLSSVTWECVRGRFCPGEKRNNTPHTTTVAP